MPSAAAVKSRLALCLAGLSALFLFAGSATSASSSSAPGPHYAQDRLLVKFKSNASAVAIARAMQAAKATNTSTIRDLRVHVVGVSPQRLETALATLRRSPSVAFAEHDGFVAPQEVLPNDPYFLNSSAWNLSGGAWGWYQTHTTQAWDITQGNASVNVAILDTGIKPAGLSDFAGQISSTWNAMNNTTDVTTNAGNHGTYVAGVVGLAAGNGAGNAGYCPQCKLMIVQVGTDSGATWSDLANGLTWAADHGARVANMSWAGTSDSSTMQAATTYAHQHGVVMTAAAGNSNCNCATYPSADPYVLGVAGTDGNGNKQYDSNYGNWAAIAAPEGNLTAFPSTNGQPGYAAFGGTSSAAPAAAGIAGLLFSYNPSLTNAQVEQALEASAVPVSFSIHYGRIDALAALHYLGATDPQPTSPPVQSAAPQIYYAANGLTSIAPLTTAPQVGQMLVRGIGGWTGSAGLNVTNLQWERCDSAGMNCTYLGNSLYYTVQSADSGYAIKLRFTMSNGLGSVPVAVLTATVGGGAPPPPALSPPSNLSPPSMSGTAQAGSTLTSSTGTWSGTPTVYAYQWQRCDSTGANCNPISGATGSSYLVQTADVGSTLVAAVTASNSAGSSTAASLPSAIVASAPPPPPPATQTQTFSGSLNAKNPTRSFSITVGAGMSNAQLSFSRCSTLNLGLTKAGGTPAGNASGPSVVSLLSSLTAGSYVYTVGGGRCSFTLTVTAPSP